MTSVGEPSRGLVSTAVDDLAVDHERDPLGTSEIEMAADGRLEPGPGTPGLIEHGGVGHLELRDGERPVEPGPAVLDGERVRDHGRHAAQQVADVAGAQPGADAMCRRGIVHGAQPVVELGETDPRVSQLALGPLVPVGAAPQRIRRVRTQLHERWPPLGVREEEVPVVGHRRLATPGDVRVVRAMASVADINEASP